MTVLADSQHREVWRVSHEQLAITFAFSRSILRLAAKPVKFFQCHFADKTIDEKTSEGLWGLIIHPEILIQMETNDTRPINTGSAGKCCQKFILRRCRRKYGDGLATRFNHSA
jgi:hypothetical protein